MVAAHNADLNAAARLGFGTAFVVQPSELGPGQATDLEPSSPFDVSVAGFEELADALDC